MMTKHILIKAQLNKITNLVNITLYVFKCKSKTKNISNVNLEVKTITKSLIDLLYPTWIKEMRE